MIEVLKQLVVPGGILTIILTWFATTHTSKGDSKTEVSRGPAEESRQIVEASGYTEEWSSLYSEMKASFNQQLDELRQELHATQSYVKSLERRDRQHLNYHYVLRTQIKGYGYDPAPWPPEIDPDGNWPPMS